MGDVLVKWRMAKTPTVVELVRELPKTRMPENEFRNYMGQSMYGPSFLRTAYQLACQLGLYYIENSEFIPRFCRNITENEALDYLRTWVWNYYVPNPYTRSFANNCKPQKIVPSIIRYLEENPDNSKLESICKSIWGEEFGNISNLKYVLQEFCGAINIDSFNQVSLDPNYKNIMAEEINRNDKKAFFDAFNQDVKSPDETWIKSPAPIVPIEENTAFDAQDYAYMAAIKTKPFLILGGFSGTGKSLTVKMLAFATCPCDGYLNRSETTPGNYLLVSVKPNWHDATDITGFRSSVNRNYYVTDFMRFLVKAKMYENKKVPFFVCLDEMNLAPVEEYFADFLSVIESRKKTSDGRIVTDPIVSASVFNDKDYADDFNIFLKLGLTPTKHVNDITEFTAEIKQSETESDFFVESWLVDELKKEGLTIPSNLVIIGTVNMDDTTNSFSRKVIDRAMTFETVVSKFDGSYFEGDVALNYVKNPHKGELFISDEVRATQMIFDGDFQLETEEKDTILAFINNINEDLEGSPFKISYRILNETILLYRAKLKISELLNEIESKDDNIEFNTSLNSIFDDILMQKVLPRIEGDYEKCNKCLTALSSRAEENYWKKSADKIEFMIRRFGKDKSGFTSFWN